MGNRRLGTRRLEAVLDNLIDHAVLNGLNGSPFSIKSPDRIYLEEYFHKRPALTAALSAPLTDADATAAANDALIVSRTIANTDFELLGTNHSVDDLTFGAAAGTPGGMKMELDGANGDTLIILPHLTSNQSLWGVADQWGSENSVQWECAITTGTAIDLQTIYAGLKKTNTIAAQTDSDQAYFVYGSTDDDWGSGALSDNTLWHFVMSSGGTDYVTALPLTVAASTNYRLGITMDSDRKVSAWVNGVQYNVTNAAGDATAAAQGVTVAAGTQKSAAMADDISLVPYVGLMGTGAARHMFLHYEKISRILFE